MVATHDYSFGYYEEDPKTIATHNSFTYFKVRGFWKKLIAWTAKCQSKTIQQQYEDYNVRMFDLRVWWDNGGIKFCHGVINYKVTYSEIKSLLRYLNTKKDCWCRVILEDKKIFKTKTYDNQEGIFKTFCKYLTVDFPNIKFFGGMAKSSWKVLYEFDNEYPDITEYNKSGFWPWIGAFLWNKKNKERNKRNCDWGMFDFINI